MHMSQEFNSARPPAYVPDKDVASRSDLQSSDGCRPRALLRRREAATTKEICRAVSRLTAEMVFVAGGNVPSRRELRRHSIHIRQMSMYICYVTLGMRQVLIGEGFGRDRSTVAHACAVVEDRRDDAAYDAFVASVERATASVFVFETEDED